MCHVGLITFKISKVYFHINHFCISNELNSCNLKLYVSQSKKNYACLDGKYRRMTEIIFL